MRDYVAPKIAAEKMLMEQLPKPDYVTLRLSTVYGPLAPGTVESVRYAMVGRQPFREAQAVQRIHVEDVVKSLMLAVSRPEAANKTMNIAGNETVGSGDYMEALRQIAAWIRQGRPHEGHYASFALLPMRYDMTRARKYLGFYSSVPLIDGLEEMVEAALPSISVTDTSAKRQPQQPRGRTGVVASARFAGWGQRPSGGPIRRWGTRRGLGFSNGFEP
jgi:nucleoside-diphosphate-sugar epimerase